MDLPSPTDEETPAVPRIVPPEFHKITTDLIEPDALYILKKLNRAGFSSYLVGGGVRDLYLEKTPKDFDICTDARPGQIRKIFPNSRTIGRRFRLVQVFFQQQKVIEVATLRSLSEYDLSGPDAVLAPNNTYGTVDEDAQRRDLTINGLFYELENHTLIDYVGGVDDLDKCVVRIIGDPSVRIHRDPVRMLRAIRHASRNNFTIEENTWEAICANSHMLTRCPPSRLRDELLKDLYSGMAADWFSHAVHSGLFNELFAIYSSAAFNSSTILDQIEKVLGVIDRTNSYFVSHQISRPKDFFILALLLLPWAEEKYSITTIKIKGPQRFQLAQRIRQDLDDNFGTQLNLRRSLRQEIVTLLMHLPVFIFHGKKGFWPKWLKKKSYFDKCCFFYRYYQEAFLDIEIPEESLANRAEKKGQKRKRSSRNKNSRPRASFPAKNQGTIFGLKK